MADALGTEKLDGGTDLGRRTALAGVYGTADPEVGGAMVSRGVIREGATGRGAAGEVDADDAAARGRDAYQVLEDRGGLAVQAAEHETGAASDAFEGGVDD